MQLLGIDPAPSKKSTIFNGKEFFEIKPLNLKPFLDDIVTKDTLISWDAPLGDNFSKSLSYKPIEQILNKKENYINLNKPPRGISTLPFSTCPHWAISQYVLGFPIVNCDITDKSKLKYHLVQNNSLSKQKPNLFETHPAYSIWVFLKDRVTNFKYKGSKDSFIAFNTILDELFKLKFLKPYLHIKSQITNDDRLDSFIAYINIKLFLQNKAFIYGNSQMGAMLLPSLDGILKKEVLETLKEDNEI